MFPRTGRGVNYRKSRDRAGLAIRTPVRFRLSREPKVTCVFVFVPQQRAALLEDLVAQVTGVHAVVGLLHLLSLRARVGVVLLLQGGVRPFLLGNNNTPLVSARGKLFGPGGNKS